MAPRDPRQIPHPVTRRPVRTVLLLGMLLSAVLMGCGPAPLESQTLTVFAAASLTDAFTEIGDAFETAHPGVEATFSFAGSQTLRTQIEAGAPADVFASANMTEMDALAASGMVAEEAPQVFLSNRLVVILPAANPGSLGQLQDLSTPGIRLILAAEDVPVGNYARRSLERMNGRFGTAFKAQVLANVVSNEDNVKQVVAKVQLGEADAGIVYTSDAVAAPDLRVIEIPSDLNVVAYYPIAVVLDSPRALLAQDFVQYVVSPAGQAILKKWGFGPAS